MDELNRHMTKPHLRWCAMTVAVASVMTCQARDRSRCVSLAQTYTRECSECSRRWVHLDRRNRSNPGKHVKGRGMSYGLSDACKGGRCVGL